MSNYEYSINSIDSDTIQVEIKESDWEEIQDKLEKLEALEMAGVEHWVGYSDAMGIVEEQLPIEFHYTWFPSPEDHKCIDVTKKLFRGDELISHSTKNLVDRPREVTKEFMESLFK